MKKIEVWPFPVVGEAAILITQNTDFLTGKRNRTPVVIDLLV